MGNTKLILELRDQNKSWVPYIMLALQNQIYFSFDFVACIHYKCKQNALGLFQQHSQ